MKKIILPVIIIALFFSIPAVAEDLSEEMQIQIIQDYLYATGQSDQRPSAAAGEEPTGPPIKCGTPAVIQFEAVKDKLDPAILKAMGVQVEERPSLPLYLDSPSGHFRIHYTTTGEDAVYTGIPHFVDSVAKIFDTVYTHIMGDLGFPAPPADDSYPEGEDEKFDVYLIDIGSGVFGLTYQDSVAIDGPGSLRATSFMVLDNDYSDIPPYSYTDAGRLNAVRVTAAHEFFHAVQFGMDYTEYELLIDYSTRTYWMEMSATWMEEEMYDYINDYYYYLPYFFDSPWASIQQFRSFRDLHPYASMVFPLYLSEKYDSEMIRSIWERCAELGVGPSFLLAADQIIDSVSDGTATFATAFQEFALWNYFTGSRADLAPEGVGYSERASWPVEFSDIGDTAVIAVHYTYPVIVQGDPTAGNTNPNPFNPDHNAAFYLRLEELQNLQYDTTYVDSVITEIDSSLTAYLALDQSFIFDWGLSVMYQMDENLDSIIVEQLTVPPGVTALEFPNPRQYRSITMVLTPASTVISLYQPLALYGDFYVAYYIPELGEIDSTLINLPAAIMAPYPNPAVVGHMADPQVRFKFQIPTDSTSFPIYGWDDRVEPYLLVDIYTVAGEYVRTLDVISESDVRTGEYWTNWDLKNSSGKQVAGGVYIAHARFFTDHSMGEMLLETKTKVAVIK